MSLLVGSCVTSHAGPCGECNCTGGMAEPSGSAMLLLSAEHVATRWWCCIKQTLILRTRLEAIAGFAFAFACNLICSF